MISIYSLAAGGVSFALLYGLRFTFLPISPRRTFVKCAATGSLFAISLLAGAPILLTLVLLFGTIGDYLLAKDPEKLFLPGLASFFLGHGALIWLFIEQNQFVAIADASMWRLVGVAAVAAFSLAMAVILWRPLGSLRLPVMLYIALIVTMGMTALMLPFEWPFVLASIGALIFIISDAILSIELFMLDTNSKIRNWTAPILWFLYWGGQALITAAFVVDVAL